MKFIRKYYNSRLGRLLMFEERRIVNNGHYGFRGVLVEFEEFFEKKITFFLGIIVSILTVLIIFVYRLILSRFRVLGWDTPFYVYMARLIPEVGVSGVLSRLEVGNHSFLYILILYLLELVGVDPYFSELVLPPILAVFVVILYGFIAYRYFNRSRALMVISMVFASLWVSVYRLCADLHRNLLSYVFFLVLILLILEWGEDGDFKKYAISCFLTILLMSFTLIHMTIFFIYVFLLYIILRKLVSRSGGLETHDIYMFILLILAIMPALYLFVTGPKFQTDVLMALHVSEAAGGLSAPVWGLRKLGMRFLMYSCGYVLTPFTLLGVLLIDKEILRGPIAKKNLIIMAWILGILMLMPLWVLSYKFCQYINRVLLFFPVPILSAYGFYYSLLFMNKIFDKFGVGWVKKGAYVLVIGFVIYSSFITTYAEASIHLRPFVPYTLHEKLIWLRNNYEFRNIPIIVFYPHPWFTKDHVNLYENYIGAILGRHYIFVGTLTDLIRLVWTPLPEKFRYYQQYYGNFLVRDGVFDLNGLREHPIVIIDDLYIQILHEDNIFERSLVYKIRDGIYIVNVSKVRSYSGYGIMLFPVNVFSVNIINGEFKFEDNYSALILEGDCANSYANVTFMVYLEGPRNYKLFVKFYDADESLCPLIIAVNGTYIGSITYSGSGKIVMKMFEFNVDISGSYMLTINIAGKSGHYFMKLYSIQICPS